MSNVLRFHTVVPTVAEMVGRVQAEYPNATEGLVVLFTPDGMMHTVACAANKNLAWAAADLLAMSISKD